MSTSQDVDSNSTAAGSSILEAAASSACAPRAHSTPDGSGGHVPFTCTFCWQEASGKIFVLGHSARLACEMCYVAILDLAVCWVCGEVVVRGDDCVSLGWCFWHRVCYGCLFYGSKRIVRGTTVDELYQTNAGVDMARESPDVFDGQDKGIMNSSQHIPEPSRGKRQDIRDMPLCANCLATEAYANDETALVQNALHWIARRDGGLARCRWDNIERQSKFRRASAVSRRVSEPISLSTVEKIPLLPGPDYSPETIDTETGFSLNRHDSSGDSVIYLSMRNPFGDEYFKPSPTKPIPEWMQPPPRRINISNHTTSKSQVELVQNFHPLQNTRTSKSSMPASSGPGLGHSKIQHSATGTQHVRETAKASMSNSLSQDIETQDEVSLLNTARGLSFISDEPLVQPSSVLGQYLRPGPKHSPPDAESSKVKAVPRRGKHSKIMTKLLSARTATIAPPQVTSPE